MTKAHKRTLEAVKQYFEEQAWDLEDIISDIVDETNLLKCKEMGDNSLSPDECCIEWGGHAVCILDEFLEAYTRAFIKGVCNTLDSFAESGLPEDED